MAKKSSYMSDNQDVREMTKEIQSIGMKHGVSTVFNDFLLMSAYAISNVFDKVHYEEREKEYLRVVKKYSKEGLNKMAELHAKLVCALEKTMYNKDLLGELFASLNQGNSSNGQFFTPMHISVLMAKMLLQKPIEDVETKGYITISEPTCGSGGMVIATANVLNEEGYNPTTSMCVCAVDIDIRCAMMTYIQLSYLGIPAVVIHGDTLSAKEFTRFYTPVYILNNWIWREQMSITDTTCLDDEKLKCMLEPVCAVMKYGFGEEKKANEQS